MGLLELRLLGTPVVTVDGSPTRMETRKGTALLAYLAVAGGPRSRDSLVNLLWPEIDSVHGRAALRQVLYRLGLQLRNGPWLDVTHESVDLPCGRGLWVDVGEFRTLVQLCRDHCRDASAVCKNCTDQLQKALGLYAGSFLSGFTLKDSVNFDDWQLVQAENLRAELQFLLDRLVTSFSSNGDLVQAIELCQRWLGLDSLNEEAHRRLMQLYLRNGQRSAALRQYHECDRVLRQEMDAIPSSATQRLFEAIRTGTVPGGPVSGKGSGVSEPAGFNSMLRGFPVQLTDLIGREAELVAISKLIDTHRLLTLVGPAGAGKTRLAIHAAGAHRDAFPDGVFFVALETAREPSEIPLAIATVLGILDVSGQPLIDVVCRSLENCRALLVLDNFEQVAAGRPLVSRLLSDAPGLKIVVTSREPVAISGEQEFPVPPLAQHAAVELFQARARLTYPGFEVTSTNSADVADICDRLDRLPLGIVLVAARIRMLAPKELLSRLDQCVCASETPYGVPDRHRTIRLAVEWSWDLLNNAERRVFSRLAVFTGGFSLDAASAICGRDSDADIQAIVSSLLAKSLIHRVGGDSPAARFSMLGTIRELAWDRLAADPAAAEIRNDHARYYCTMSEDLGIRLLRWREAETLWTLDAEYSNLRAALEWCAAGGHAETGYRIVSSLRHYWGFRDIVVEGLAWARRYLELDAGASQALLGRTCLAAAGFHYYRGEHCESREMFLAAESYARAAGDRESEGLALCGLTQIDLCEADPATAAEDKLARAIDNFKEIGSPDGMMFATNCLGDVMRARGRYGDALCLYARAISIGEECGLPPNPRLMANIGDSHRHLGDVAAATDCFRRSLQLAISQRWSSRSVAWCIEILASVSPDAAVGARLVGAASAIRKSVGIGIQPADMAEHNEIVARVRSGLGESDFARFFAEGAALSKNEAVAEALRV